MIAYPNSDPKDRTMLYIAMEPRGTSNELYYEIIDLDSKFDNNILNSEEGLNNALNEIILKTTGGITSAAAFNK